MVLDAKILVVDDVPLMRDLIGLTLKQAGYHNLFYAEDGDVALKAVKAHDPDIVILDLTFLEFSY